MTRLVFHIGMHKTGSTSIQLSYHGLDDEAGLFPTLLDQPNHTVPILRAFASGARDIFLKRAQFGRRHDDVSREAAREAIGRAAGDAKGRTLILSSEGAYNKLVAEDWADVRDFFAPLVDEFQIIAYARPPVAFASSIFQEVVKGSQIGRFKIIVKDYGEFFEPIFEAFGAESVEIVPFGGFDVVEDFARRTGVAPPRSRRSNEAISLPATAMLYAFNRQFDGADSGMMRQAAQAIGGAVTEPDDAKLRFVDSLIAPLVTDAMRSWCEKRIGEDFIDLGRGEGNVACEADLIAADPGWRDELETALEHRKLSDGAKDLIARFIASRKP